MERKERLVRGLLLGALVTCIYVPTVKADNVKATLHTNQTKEATKPLGRDAAKDQFILTGGVLASSKHNVQYCYGGSSSTWNSEKDPAKYQLSDKRTWTLSKGEYKSLKITQKMCSSNFVKVCMYGNSEKTKKKKCYADAVLVNN